VIEVNQKQLANILLVAEVIENSLPGKFPYSQLILSFTDEALPQQLKLTMK
jgi:hypothetical protein